MHTDEAVHAEKFGILLETGEYEYNPHEYHGPLIYYSALPFARATGAKTLADLPDERPLRLPIVIYSALLAGAVVLCGQALGRTDALYAGILFAVSPAFAFYGKYFIQEVPFVFFCFVALACAWQMLQTAQWRWAIATGLATGCAIALKETWVMIMGSAALTALLLHLTTSSGATPRPIDWKKYTPLALLTILLSLLTGIFILSNFFQNPAAIWHTFSAIGGYINRGISGDSSTFGAGIHDHPWYYYFQLLTWPKVEGPWVWTEGITYLLGIIGLISTIRRWTDEPRPWHAIAILTLLLTAFYSAIPYKTPWNVLPMFTGWTLLAGHGASVILHTSIALTSRISRHPITRHATCALIWPLLLAWPAWLSMQTYRATITRSADTRNPYAYSPTSPNLLRLANRAHQLAAHTPDGKQMLIQIISPENDYWPLPWYLRHFTRIGYYNDPAQAHPGAAMIIMTHTTDPDADPPQSPQGIGQRMQEFYGLRPDVLLNVYIQQDLWDAFMADNQ